MKIKFTKMHGLGNDFIVVMYNDSIKETIENKEIIKKLCTRRYGIGADQLLLICPSTISDYKMKIFNADGTEVEMCGNGIRCLAKYLHKKGRNKKQFSVETQAGIIKPEIIDDMVCVDMGEPELEGEKIPLTITGSCINHTITAGDRKFSITAVSMGNPHCVIFCDSVLQIPLEEYGPILETHPLFPNKTNVEFVEIVNAETIKMRVWERGSGITAACGTGACASAVASILNNHTKRKITVMLDGGDLSINWEKEPSRVFMTGPSESVFEGEISV